MYFTFIGLDLQCTANWGFSNSSFFQRQSGAFYFYQWICRTKLPTEIKDLDNSKGLILFLHCFNSNILL